MPCNIIVLYMYQKWFDKQQNLWDISLIDKQYIYIYIYYDVDHYTQYSYNQYYYVYYYSIKCK